MRIQPTSLQVGGRLDKEKGYRHREGVTPGDFPLLRPVGAHPAAVKEPRQQPAHLRNKHDRC